MIITDRKTSQMVNCASLFCNTFRRLLHDFKKAPLFLDKEIKRSWTDPFWDPHLGRVTRFICITESIISGHFLPLPPKYWKFMIDTDALTSKLDVWYFKENQKDNNPVVYWSWARTAAIRTYLATRLERLPVLCKVLGLDLTFMICGSGAKLFTLL